MDPTWLVVLFVGVVAFAGVMITLLVTLLRAQISSSSEALSRQLEQTNASVERQLDQQTRTLERLIDQTAQRTDKLQDRVAVLGSTLDELASRVRDLER